MILCWCDYVYMSMGGIYLFVYLCVKYTLHEYICVDIYIYACVCVHTRVYSVSVFTYLGVCLYEFMGWVTCCSILDPLDEIRTRCKRFELVLLWTRYTGDLKTNP